MAIHVPARERQIAEPTTGAIVEAWLRFFLGWAASYGTWYQVDHLAANFTGSGSMTWVVQAADQITLAYTLMGKRMDVAFTIRDAVVGGVVGPTLRIALPGTDGSGNAFTAARDMSVPVWVNDNGTKAIGVARVTAGSSLIQIQKVDGSNWTAGANGVEGVIALEVG